MNPAENVLGLKDFFNEFLFVFLCKGGRQSISEWFPKWLWVCLQSVCWCAARAGCDTTGDIMAFLYDRNSS